MKELFSRAPMASAARFVVMFGGVTFGVAPAATAATCNANGVCTESIALSACSGSKTRDKGQINGKLRIQARAASGLSMEAVRNPNADHPSLSKERVFALKANFRNIIDQVTPKGSCVGGLEDNRFSVTFRDKSKGELGVDPDALEFQCSVNTKSCTSSDDGANKIKIGKVACTKRFSESAAADAAARAAKIGCDRTYRPGKNRFNVKFDITR